MPEIDVVMPTRNRPKSLVRALEALSRQTYREFGVIVIDDASDPPVTEILPETLSSKLNLRVLRNDQRGGPACARNRGVGESTATYIAFVDDDVYADPNLLERHLETMRSLGGRGVVIGPLKEPPDWKPAPWCLWEARQLQRFYDRVLSGEFVVNWRALHTGNALVRRDALVELGGFDERFLRAEDIELGLRLEQADYPFAYRDDAIGWHYIERSRDAWLETARSYARAHAMLDRKYPQMHWGATVRAEAARRHPALRWARRLMVGRRLRRVSVRAAAFAASALFAAGLRQSAMLASSMAYDLEWDWSLRREGI